MREEIEFFKTKLNEQPVVERFIYLLNSDSGGYRDGLVLDKGAITIEGLKKILIEEQKEMFYRRVLPETIEVNENREKIEFAYIDMIDDEYNPQKEWTDCTYHKMIIIQ